MPVTVTDTTPGVSHKIQSQEMLSGVENTRTGFVKM